MIDSVLELLFGMFLVGLIALGSCAFATVLGLPFAFIRFTRSEVIETIRHPYANRKRLSQTRFFVGYAMCLFSALFAVICLSLGLALEFVLMLARTAQLTD